MGAEGFSILILGAGKATRFKSEYPKLLHPLAGRLMGEYVLRAATAAGAERLYMIIGHQAEAMRRAFAREGLEFIEQKEQLGTGHALIVARPELERCPTGVVVALVGDAPLLRPETLSALVATHCKERAACTILTMRPDNPTGYGRIVRVGGKRVRAIVEEKVASAAQKRISEVNTGILCFSRQHLLAHLGELSRENAQKEYLLTDLVEIFNRHRLKVAAYEAPGGEAWGINDRVQLAEVEKTLRLHKATTLMKDGVTIADPATTYIDEDVVIGPDTVIEPGVSLRGQTRIGSGCHVGPYSTITDSTLADGVTVRQSCVITKSEVGAGVAIGPFAHLRLGAVIEPEARIGNFVEIKKSTIGRGAKAQHLTYLGDATVGAHTNIGAGTITCNYDGEKKNPTTIEDEVFIGSGNMLVAPVHIGRGAYTAAGSTITKDVPPESLAIGRSHQVNKESWARERKKR
ncbi:MAG: bifunctional UDP-N-acetylglucosamine diphosphorylase/glucosamine-1-phosphate N-acetyltransferase GlmU [Acidobacteriota bacterium]|nr:bifunctional UDP-N-acetylglucosamine diphosphorylase/glucosamine-1-phosphate N-acetyltransferase GlmU [Acidobacteriota bacterium]